MVPLPMTLIKCHKIERKLYLQTYRYRPVKQIREDTATNIMKPEFTFPGSHSQVSS